VEMQRPDVVVERDDARRAGRFGAEREVAIPRADVEHGLAGERRQPHLVPLGCEERGRFLAGRDALAEVDAVEPVDGRHGANTRLRRVQLDARVATDDDRDAVAETIVVAFQNDPVWSWAFPDAAQRPAQFRRWWPLFVESALPHGWVWMAPKAATIAPVIAA